MSWVSHRSVVVLSLKWWLCFENCSSVLENVLRQLRKIKMVNILTGPFMVSTTMPDSNWDFGPEVIRSPLCCSLIWTNVCKKIILNLVQESYHTTIPHHLPTWSVSEIHSTTQQIPVQFFYGSSINQLCDWLCMECSLHVSRLVVSRAATISRLIV